MARLAALRRVALIGVRSYGRNRVALSLSCSCPTIEVSTRRATSAATPKMAIPNIPRRVPASRSGAHLRAGTRLKMRSGRPRRRFAGIYAGVIFRCRFLRFGGTLIPDCPSRSDGAGGQPVRGFETVTRILAARYQNSRGWRRGSSRPKYSYARGVATRPRGVRSIMPICMR